MTEAHLGAIIGSEEYIDLYIDEKITGWIDEIRYPKLLNTPLNKLTLASLQVIIIS